MAESNEGASIVAQPQITELRSELFATIKDLRNPEKPMDVERARTIALVAQTIINSAKAETDFLATVGQRRGSGFIPQPEAPPASPPRQLSAAK